MRTPIAVQIGQSFILNRPHVGGSKTPLPCEETAHGTKHKHKHSKNEMSYTYIGCLGVVEKGVNVGIYYA